MCLSGRHALCTYKHNRPVWCSLYQHRHHSKENTVLNFRRYDILATWPSTEIFLFLRTNTRLSNYRLSCFQTKSIYMSSKPNQYLPLLFHSNFYFERHCCIILPKSTTSYLTFISWNQKSTSLDKSLLSGVKFPIQIY